MTTAMAVKDILAKYGPEMAVYAILTSTLGNSDLQPEVANRYIREVIDRTVVVNAARRLPMASNTRNIDRLTHSGRVMVFPAEGTAPAVAGALAFGQRQLLANRMAAAEDWSQETIEDNIEGTGLEDTLVDVMATLFGRDFEELALYGNADDVATPAWPDAATLGDVFRENLGSTAHDGWLLLSDNVTDKLGVAPTKTSDLFNELMDAIPSKILDGSPRADWRIYCNSRIERKYREEVGERSTNLGDRALFENVPMSHQGIPVVSVPVMRFETRDFGGGDITECTDLMLVHPNNLVVGFQRNVTMDIEKKPRSGTFELTITSRGDANVEDPAAYATIINTKLVA